MNTNESLVEEQHMEFYELIKNRESIRDYDPENPVDDATLYRILGAGRFAPSAVNNQPWRFLVVSSPEMLRKVKECYHQPWFKDAPQILVVTGKRKDAWVRKDGYNSLETDLAIAMTHLILAAENEGVATCWVQAFNLKALKEALEMYDDEDQIYSVTPLGYPKEGFVKKAAKQRKPLKDIVVFL